MPTVLEIEGYKFYFYSKEGNEPPHVHVKKGGGEAKFWLEPQFKLDHYFGFKEQELKKAVKLAYENKVEFINKWNEYFKRTLLHSYH